MKAWQLTSQTGPAALQRVDLPEPTPGPGQVLVRVQAASLNYRDQMVADGRYGRVNLPLVPLSDGAGEIAAVGAGVTRWQPGDRVAGTFFQGWASGSFRREYLGTALGGALPGMLAEYVVLGEAGVVGVPSHLDFIQAATLPCAGLTAWHALVTGGKVNAGETVLLLGTGGVSLFALQFAKMHGARVIIISSSDEKLARAEALGADAVINYRQVPDWEKEVFRLTGKSGVDQVVEVGGAGTLAKSLRCLASGGQVHLVGGVSGFSGEVPLLDIISKMAVVRGIYVGSLEMFEAMNRALHRHRIEPVVDRVFDFADATAACEYQLSGAHTGKVVIKIDPR
jgi:NADPH:quinone reductase-like Zn-dependent oxidoreductase